MLHKAERAEPRYGGFGRRGLYSDTNTSSEEGYRDNGDCVNSQASGRSRKRVTRVAETRWGHRRVCRDRPFSSKGQSGWEIRDLKRAGNRVNERKYRMTQRYKQYRSSGLGWPFGGSGRMMSFVLRSLWSTEVSRSGWTAWDLWILILSCWPQSKMALCQKTGCEHLLYLPLKDQQRSHHRKRNWRVNSPQVCSNCIAKIKHWPPHEGWTFKMLSISSELHPSCSCWKLQSRKYPSTDTELNWALDSIWILITWMHLELKHTNKPQGQKRLKQDLFQRSLLNFTTEWSYQNRR